MEVSTHSTRQQGVLRLLRRVWNIVALCSFLFCLWEVGRAVRPYVLPHNPGASAREMGGLIHSGMTKEAVENEIGMPDAVRGQNSGTNSQTFLIYDRPDGNLTIEITGQDASGSKSDETAIVKSREFTARATP